MEAYVLIQTEVGRAEVVARQIAALPGVLSADDVTGPYDVVVKVGAAESDAMQEVVAVVQGVDGITRTLTCPIAGASH